MTVRNISTVAATLLFSLILAACTGIRPSDPEYADYVRCGGRNALFETNSIRTCMDEQNAARQARLEERQRKELAEQKEREQRDAEYAKQQVESAEREQAQRRDCGNDYGQLRVGMTLDRVKRCWPRFGWFRLTGEINRADGVVSIYSIPFDDRGSLANAIGVSAIYVMQGKIVGWTR